jgi:hypothetical protein
MDDLERELQTIGGYIGLKHDRLVAVTGAFGLDKSQKQVILLLNQQGRPHGSRLK